MEKNNNMDAENEDFDPEKKAFDSLFNGNNETPEKWLKKLDSTQNEMNEKDPASKDKRNDYIFLYFKKINPLGIPIADLKDNLNNEISKLRDDIEDIKINESLSSEQKERYIKLDEELIAEKKNWISHIDDFILKGDSEPFEDSQMDAEHKKEKIMKILDQQTKPEQN